MKKYLVSIPYYASVMVEVEAKNKTEAITIAYENCNPSLCHQCSDGIELFEASIDEDPDVEEME